MSPLGTWDSFTLTVEHLEHNYYYKIVAQIDCFDDTCWVYTAKYHSALK